MRRVVFLLLILHVPASRASGENKKTIAKLESKESVTEQDLADWLTAQNCYPEGMHNRHGAFMQLFETAVLETFLKKDFKFKLGRNDYQKERERIDRETLFPEVISCIKNNLHSNKRYEYTFARPILVNQNFYSRLPNDENIQAIPRTLAKKTETAIGEKNSFQEIANKFSISFSTLTIYFPMPGEEILPIEKRPPLSEDTQQEYAEKYLSALRPGEASQAIEKEDQILFLKLLEKESPKFHIERLTIPKVTQKEYFNNVKKLKVTIYDAELKNWVQSINGNPMLKALEIAP